MDGTGRVWRSPGLGALAAAGVLRSVFGGVVAGILFGAVFAWVLMVADVVISVSLIDVFFFVFVGLYCVVIGTALGVVAGVIASVTVVPVVVLWLTRSPLTGQPLERVAGGARWRGALMTLAVVALLSWSQVREGDNVEWAVFVLGPSVMAVVYAWFASGHLVLTTSRDRAAPVPG